MNAFVEKTTFDFLKKLSANNDRDWFNAHKAQYEKAKGNVEQFMDALIAKMNTHDRLETPSGKKSLYRIYNDVRFAKDKSPYNPRFAGYMRRSKPQLRGGYYIWIAPGVTRVGCGFSYPHADDLRRIRLDITANPGDWRKMLRSKAITSHFGEMVGEQVKTTPRGFSADDPAIDLLRFKQYWFERSFTDREALSPDFLLEVNKTYKSIRPFFDYMSDVLGTDLNGEPIR
ncbi:DUF2461 domain-containing protein [Chryseolinea soli]|uniref:DUF2461 domain-containing protein n=1 Tax=Chryseolinea soli TaxID=2321403 RepID=A0A385SMW1_9BACT|nr:DUF2461 domain-containing protein [Chryseolinea soli]AYB31607.1 DUF2461 domain-containing protein [Chryseolinea soli]